MRRAIGLFILLSLTLGCASRGHLATEYQELAQQKPQEFTKQTVVVFLVDGLPARTLARLNLPNIKRHFADRTNGSGLMGRAHSVFPSLTFTNIASLLEGRPVHLSQAIGNKLVWNGRYLDFDSISDRQYFTEKMRGQTLFSRLKEKNQLSVSLDYGLGADASLTVELDFRSAYSASQMDYDFVDQKKIDSLANLLSETNVNFWPRFIFIHLVGVDFHSHRFGPNAAETSQYIEKLDRKLGAVFKTLRKAEKKREVISILTADHGFNTQARSYFDIDAKIKALDEKFVVSNEARLAAVYTPQPVTEKDLQQMAQKLFQERSIEIVAGQVGRSIIVQSREKRMEIEISPNQNCGFGILNLKINGNFGICADRLPENLRHLFYPYFLEGISSYFLAKNSPDLVVIPNAQTVFSNQGGGFQGGYHGGPTAEEIEVPLLLRNLKIRPAIATPASWQILEFMK